MHIRIATRKRLREESILNMRAHRARRDGLTMVGGAWYSKRLDKHDTRL
jgi:hypothetical protein